MTSKNEVLIRQCGVLTLKVKADRVWRKDSTHRDFEFDPKGLTVVSFDGQETGPERIVLMHHDDGDTE